MWKSAGMDGKGEEGDWEEGKWMGSGTVLIVDDKKSVLSVGKDMLERNSFTVLTAKDGRVAGGAGRKGVILG
jgi:response regulator RpfG family c-di-GMP phosphodiesterase